MYIQAFIVTSADISRILMLVDWLRLLVFLQTCNVDVVLLVIYCMYIQAFIVTSADISQLWVYFCYLLLYCLVVYKLVMFMERGMHHAKNRKSR